MNFKQEFGQTCKAARIALNLTTSELATMVNMSRQQIANIESGRSFPGDVDTLLNALKIDIKMTPPGRVTHIHITAKEWFDKTYGNSYFSAQVTIRKHKVETETICLPFQYGYGDYSEHEAAKAIFAAGYFPEHNDGRNSLYTICRELGIEFTCTKYEDQKKADVVAFGKAY